MSGNISIPNNNVSKSSDSNIKKQTENTKGAGSSYMFYNNMDTANKKAMDVVASQGINAAINHMFHDQETGRTLTYGEMRARYG